MTRALKLVSQLTMALLLSLGLILPSGAFGLAAPEGESECMTCLVPSGDEASEAFCCGSEEGEPCGPCEDSDCECPYCPKHPSPASALMGVLSPAAMTHAGVARSLFSPNTGLGFEKIVILPPLPPPRVG